MVTPSVADLTAGLLGPEATFQQQFQAGAFSPADLANLRLAGLVPQEAAPEASIVGDAGQQVPLTTQGPGEMNIPFGADFLQPTLNLQGILAQLQEQQRQFGLTLPEEQRQFDVNAALQRQQLLGQQGQFGQTLAEQQRQFNTQSLFNTAASLANLRAQGPQSAAELAFSQAGLGLPAIGGSAQNIEGLFGATTRGAGGGTTFEAGGQRVGIPNTLGGAQLAQLQGNPNLAGVLGSFARASGNPDLLARSVAALLPSGFQGAGSGL